MPKCSLFKRSIVDGIVGEKNFCTTDVVENFLGSINFPLESMSSMMSPFLPVSVVPLDGCDGCGLDYFRLDECYSSVQAYLRLNGCYHLVRGCFCLNKCVGHWRHLGVDYHLHVLLSLERGRDCLLKYYLVSSLFQKVHLKIADRWVCLFLLYDSFPLLSVSFHSRWFLSSYLMP